MKLQLEEAQRKEAKATSECSALKNGVKGVKDSFARDLKHIRDDMGLADERWKKEGDEMRAKNEALVALVRSQS
jgi:DNA helicase IV